MAVVWTVAAALGTTAMMKYEFTPGVIHSAPGHWPAATQISRDRSQPTLLLFLHPRCPCSRATLAELERLEAECEGRFAVRIVFVRPPGASGDWEKTSLCSAARRMAAARITSDVGGGEAARFGATTSGEALLYANDGRLLFHGGLTASRGHEGDNAGHSAVAALITGGTATCGQTPVFGCSLINHSEASRDLSHATTD